MYAKFHLFSRQSERIREAEVNFLGWFDNDRPSNEKLSFEIYAYTFDVCGSKSVVIPRLITALAVEAVEPALR